MAGVVRAMSKALHYVAGGLIIGVMVVTVYNILGRWLFNAPFRGTVELTQLAMVGIVYLGLAYAQQRDDHIAVDLVYQRFARGVRIVMDVFGALLSVVVLGLMAWQLTEYADVLASGGRETASRAIPLAPFAYVAMVGVAAFTVAVASTTITRLRTGRPDDLTDDHEQAAP